MYFSRSSEGLSPSLSSRKAPWVDTLTQKNSRNIFLEVPQDAVPPLDDGPLRDAGPPAIEGVVSHALTQVTQSSAQPVFGGSKSSFFWCILRIFYL